MKEVADLGSMPAKDIADRFAALQKRLPGIWSAIASEPDCAHTSVILPSFSVDQEELNKVVGAVHYEERLLFALIRLRNPNARLIYISSQPIHPDIVDYYLDLLEGVTARHARARLHMVSVYDASVRPLTEKVLERPRLLARLRGLVGDAARAYLTCYNSTDLERRLAVALDVPLNGVDPDLLFWGTKTSNRRLFAEAGVRHPAGSEGLNSADELVEALMRLARDRPGLEQAVVKLNQGFGGEGNGVFTYPASPQDPGAIRGAMESVHWTHPAETTDSFLRKLRGMGGVAEELITGDDVRSPSVQMRISPDGQPQHVSSHEQLLGGATGQTYLGCRFPADEAYRSLLMREAAKIGDALSSKGVIGRFAIDFLVHRDDAGGWQAHAIEINLRMGGTTPPFYALEFLTGGRLDADTGVFLSPDGQAKYYTATDNLKSPSYRGLLPEDLFEIVARRDLDYRHATGSGVLFHMVGALSQYGKLGMTCIANSPEEAERQFRHTTAVLDEETGGDGHAVRVPLLDRYYPME